ncbi:NAD(P)-binding protein [Coniophora puteana RWD-64-598 SS2]|uniref:NAD(P)-binding protein n=1 Tax=Coniophora puteana (strain RWD-64-598) TaxID=741705 RepID=A0A5M3N2G3_CONPW|nr:NAD(P)-binding protein [Coniophora puteana RWD-64-598 SS2]EIW85558.1 NAD(P)-binding protein [Coniophora puteana RWD-64-598 SS2]
MSNIPLFKSFAVIGAGGNIGKYVVEATENANVLVLTRPSSTAANAPGTQVERVDYADTDAVAAALTKHRVEVVVSAVGFEGHASQGLLAQAAVKAGVQLFVPSEFGVPSYGATEGILGEKSHFVDILKQLRLPYLCLYTGIFTEFFPGLVNVESGKYMIAAEGKTPFSTTAMSDIGGYLAHVLTSLPTSELKNHVLRIEGDRGSLLYFAKLYEGRAPVARVEKLPEDAPHSELSTFLHKRFDTGAGSTRWDIPSGREIEGPNANGLWEGHKWKSVKDVLDL